MHLRRTAVIVTVFVAAVVIVVIAALAFMGLFGQGRPTKDDPASYTRAVVQEAIERYERDGKQSTIEHYNNPENRDGQWYAFIVDEDGLHHIPPQPRDQGKRPESARGRHRLLLRG